LRRPSFRRGVVALAASFLLVPVGWAVGRYAGDVADGPAAFLAFVTSSGDGADHAGPTTEPGVAPTSSDFDRRRLLPPSPFTFDLAAPASPDLVVGPPSQHVTAARRPSRSPERTRSEARSGRSAPLFPEEPEPPPVPPVPADPPPAEPLTIDDVTVDESDSEASLTFHTSFPATAQAAYGPGATPLVWGVADGPDIDHSTSFHGLSPSTTYQTTIRAVDRWERVSTVTFTFQTDDMAEETHAGISGDTILVNGEPMFPRAIWNECTNAVGEKIDLGINLFMAEGCGKEEQLPKVLGGRAYSVVDAESEMEDEPGLLGWYYPDELDGRLSPPLTESDIKGFTVDAPPGLLRFLTLTNHFYTGASPLPIGRSLYPAFVGLADIVGFDLYPLQNWCQLNKVGDVYDAQKELDALSNHKPTFQWIEVRVMDCPPESYLIPTPETVRAETWLAIAGGADGIGYFPREWSHDVGDQIQSLNTRIEELAPALLADDLPVETGDGRMKAGARTLNGATYVIAVNSSQSPIAATVKVPLKGTQTFDVLDENRRIEAVDGVINDTFDPLAVHVYITAPEGWGPAAEQPLVW
jgi:hypothetical protein